MFRLLSNLGDPGGKIIVSIASIDEPVMHRETFEELDSGLPPEATYVGYLLFNCGRGAFFKNWVIREEGGREKNPALQGEKAANDEQRRRGLSETVTRPTDFLNEERINPRAVQAARDRARSILRSISIENLDLESQTTLN